MRAEDPSVHLTPEQEKAASAGLKALIPIAGRPFLDYVLGIAGGRRHPDRRPGHRAG